MKIHSAISFACLAILSLPAHADTFVMKDGTTVEGTILRKDETSYVVEVQVTGSIKDERVIARADVESIKESKPDLIAFEAISGLLPTPDGLSPDEYADRISEVEKFIAKHRGSSKTTDARKMVAALKAEANEILAGGVKLNGKIISPVEYRANAYEIDARIEGAKIKRLVDDARYLEALRAFSKFDADFRNTTVHDEINPLINRVIRTYIGGISQLVSNFDARTKQREIGLERMTLEDRRVSEKAIAEENVAIEKRFNAEKAAKIGWVTTHPFFKPSLDETVNFGRQELTRLANQNKLPVVDGGKAYRNTLSLIQGAGEKTAIAAGLAEAKSAGLPQRYLDILEAAAKSSGFTP